MSEYNNFEYDFIRRTLDILENYWGKYDVTSLINNCIGLLVLPKELLAEKIPIVVLSDFQKSYGITKKNIIFIKPEKKDIRFENYNEYNTRNVVTHMRNAISHGHIVQESVLSEQIEELCFKDYDSSNITFEAVLSIEELKDFAILIAKEVLNSEQRGE